MNKLQVNSKEEIIAIGFQGNDEFKPYIMIFFFDPIKQLLK